MGWLLINKKSVLFFTVICFLIIGALPVLFMLIKSVTIDGSFSLHYYKNLLNSKREWMLVANSLSLSLLTTFFTIVIGVPLGILLAKTDIPLKKMFVLLFTLPLLIPPYITAVSWFGILGRNGLISKIFNPNLADITSKLLFGLPGCVLVLTSTFLPVVVLLTITFLKTIDPQVEEAGIVFAGWPRVLKKIIVPIIMPGILLAALLVFLLTLGEFGVPTFLRYNVFAVESFTQFSAFYNFGAATAAATPLLFITFIILLIERFFLRDKTYQLRPVAGEKSPKINLRGYKTITLVFVSAFCFFIVVLPLLILICNSLSPAAYKEALSRAGNSLIRSVFFAIIGATALSFLGFFLGYLIHTKSFRLWRAVDSLTIFLFTLSGAVIGIGLINLWNHPSTNFIYATPIIIFIGYLAKYTALTSRITVSSLVYIPPSMEEAAQVFGTKWFRRIALIIVPMAKRGLIAAWLVGYIFCLRDTGVTMLVYPSGSDTLPVRIFTLMANGSTQLIAALCVIMISVTLIPLGIGGALYKFLKIRSESI